MKTVEKLLKRYTDNELIYLSHYDAEPLRLYVEAGRDAHKLKLKESYKRLRVALETALYHALRLDVEAFILIPIERKERQLQEKAHLAGKLPKQILQYRKQLANARHKLRQLNKMYPPRYGTFENCPTRE